MADAMDYRGPDGAGHWCSDDGRVAFGHRRLAIRDLTSAAAQPMHNDDAAVVLTFNGEIYNAASVRMMLEKVGHEFHSTGDTEVVLHAFSEWGETCIERLDGMFAFAAYDERSRRIFLARDRAGEKPLYYLLNKQGLIFSSELRPLLGMPGISRLLDYRSLNYYLAYGHCPSDTTLVQGVSKLPAAHAMTFDVDTKQSKIWRYWTLPRLDTCVSEFDDLVNEFENLLERSVGQMMVADVPVGVLLSGGMDSSLVAAMAVRHAGRQVKTFTVSFPGHGRFDEAPHARRVAEHLGTEHTELVADHSFIASLPNFLKKFDEPIGTHSTLPMYLLSTLVQDHVKVALGGDGGDELFGGYPHYSLLARKLALERYVPAAILKGVSALARAAMPLGSRGRTHLVGLGTGISGAIAHSNMFFDREARHRLLAPAGRERASQSSPENQRVSRIGLSANHLDYASKTDFVTTLCDSYLVKVDRASMLASLEVRAPLLDRALVEFAFQKIPDHAKVRGQSRKIIVAALVRKLFGNVVDVRRKQGFTMPLSVWVHQNSASHLEAAVRDLPAEIFRRETCQEILKSAAKSPGNANRFFALAAFGLWQESNGILVG